MSNELPITDPPRWSVRTKYHSQSKEEKRRKEEPVIKHHELTFGGVSHEKGKGEGELERLRSLAIIFNRRQVIPRRLAVECAADAPNARIYLQKISGLR
ncbi:MAG: hypothetical protein Q8Q59_08330 [Luteolibacter sp.]|jgi:hypothetical protein|nr:hypothetical protein [Luteolibacter sp.]